MNNSEKDITHEELKRIVGEVTDSDINRWIDKHISGANAPIVPDDEELFSESLDKIDQTGTTGGGISSGAGTIAGPDNRCPECGAPTDTEGELCESCTREPDQLKCPVCDEDVEECDEICSACGIHLGRQCPVCDTSVLTEQYCPSCGTELVFLCSVCGNRIDRAVSDAEYCSGCGIEIEV